MNSRWLLIAPLLFVACVDGPLPPPDDSQGGSPSSGQTCHEDSDCSDGLFCNGVESCDPLSKKADETGCVASAVPPNCDDQIACTVDRCSEADEACESKAPDLDGDGYGDSSCTDQNDSPLGDDCDDQDAERYPGNVEVCDEADRDEDCDTQTFGELDADSDGAIADTCCNEDNCGDDCNDASIAVRPLQPEFCDGLDNNCDGKEDNDTRPVPWYVDDDGDGFGSSSESPTYSCEILAGLSLLPTDCNDKKASYHPGAVEKCGDKVDNDCNGVADEGDECQEPAGVPTCAGETTSCGSACVDVTQDPHFCGNCFTSCGEAEACSSGECVPLDGTGGASGTGGQPSSGGATGSGGQSSSGGATGTGGASPGPNDGADAILLDGICRVTCTSASADQDNDGFGAEQGHECLVEGSVPFQRGAPCSAEEATLPPIDGTIVAARSILYSESFESGLGSWTVTGDFSRGTPPSETLTPIDGQQLLGSGVAAPYGKGTSRATGPWLDVPAREALPYFLYQYWYSLSPGDEVHVEFRTEDNGAWHDFEAATGTISHMQGDNPRWVQGMLPLDLLGGRSVQLSFVLESGDNPQNKPGFFLDQVALEKGFMRSCGCPVNPGDWVIEGGQFGMGSPTYRAGLETAVAGTNLSGPYQSLAKAPRARLATVTQLVPSGGFTAHYMDWRSLHAGTSVRVQIREAGGAWKDLPGTSPLTGRNEIWRQVDVVLDAYQGRVVQLGYLFENGGGAAPNTTDSGFYVSDFKF